MIVDPDSPPSRILVVPDLNTVLDVALDRYCPAEAIRPDQATYRPRFPEPSKAFFESLATTQFGDPRKLSNRGPVPELEAIAGVPVSVFSSCEALELLTSKLLQPLEEPNPEFRGFGWTTKQAERFLDEFFLPLIDDTGGDLFLGVPAVDVDRFGGEDGRIIGIAHQAGQLWMSEDTMTVVVTRDKGLIEANGKRSFDQSGQFTVVTPLEYLNDERTFARRTIARTTPGSPYIGLAPNATPKDLDRFLGRRPLPARPRSSRSPLP